MSRVSFKDLWDCYFYYSLDVAYTREIKMYVADTFIPGELGHYVAFAKRESVLQVV